MTQTQGNGEIVPLLLSAVVFCGICFFEVALRTQRACWMPQSCSCSERKDNEQKTLYTFVLWWIFLATSWIWLNDLSKHMFAIWCFAFLFGLVLVVLSLTCVQVSKTCLQARRIGRKRVGCKPLTPQKICRFWLFKPFSARNRETLTIDGWRFGLCPQKCFMYRVLKLLVQKNDWANNILMHAKGLQQQCVFELFVWQISWYILEQEWCHKVSHAWKEMFFVQKTGENYSKQKSDKMVSNSKPYFSECVKPRGQATAKEIEEGFNNEIWIVEPFYGQMTVACCKPCHQIRHAIQNHLNAKIPFLYLVDYQMSCNGKIVPAAFQIRNLPNKAVCRLICNPLKGGGAKKLLHVSVAWYQFLQEDPGSTLHN